MSLPNGSRTESKEYQTAAKIHNLLLAAVIIFLSISLLGNSMAKELGRDENVYCTSGYLIAQGKLIYRDFSYISHPPYYPLILALLYRVMGTSHYLLMGRLSSVVCEIGILLCIIAIIKSTLKNHPKFATLFSVCAVLMYVMNPFVIDAGGYAWNHSVVVLCVLFCLWLFTNMDAEKINFRRLFAIGAILTFAVFVRHTTGLVYCVFALMIMLIAPGRLRKGKATALPFIIGSLVLAAWPLIVISKSPEAFVMDIVKIPALNAAYLRETGIMYNKLYLTKVALLSPSYISLIILAVYLLIFRLVSTEKPSRSDKQKMRLFISIAAVFALIVFIPPMMWVQYWALPVAFIVVAMAQPLNHLCNITVKDSLKKRYLTTATVLLFIAVGVALYEGLPSAIVSVINAFNRNTWVPLRVHKVSEDIHSKLLTDGPVLTLSPLYAIEGGSEIYPEFSTGPFVYRIADKLSESQRRIVHAVGPDGLKSLVKSRPASAVILNTETKQLEESIIEQVVQPDWSREVYGEDGPVVYFRK